MKSRALVHSKYESRLLGARPQGSQLPSGLPAARMPGHTPGRLATEQAPRQSLSAGYQSQPLRLPKIKHAASEIQVQGGRYDEAADARTNL